MPDLDLKSLREIAIEATPELWVAVADSAYGWDHPVVDVPKQDSEFITIFNPVTVLALLDEIDRLKERLGHLRSATFWIDARGQTHARGCTHDHA
jgi:hypothetical protein